MKTIIWLFLLGSILLFAATNTSAQGPADSTVNFKVFGVCEMCKYRIEEAVNIKGVKSAEWNIDSKLLTLTYDPARVTIDKIHGRITNAGHDTYLKKANDAVYNSLPECCRFREFESMSDMPVSDNSDSVETSTTTLTTVNTIKGVVLEEDPKGALKPLVAASVIWLGTTIGTITDSTGVFTLTPVRGNSRLVVSYADYKSDTVTIVPATELKIILAIGKQLQEVKITAGGRLSQADWVANLSTRPRRRALRSPPSLRVQSRCHRCSASIR